MDEPTPKGPVELWPEDIPVEQMIVRLRDEHESILEDRIPRLRALLERARPTEDVEYGTLLDELGRQLMALRLELESHLATENRLVFPYAEELVEAACGEGQMPREEEAVLALESGHENARKVLGRIRRLATEFVPPEETGPEVQQFYDGVSELEADLTHHLEWAEEVFIPRLRDLEESLREQTGREN